MRRHLLTLALALSCLPVLAETARQGTPEEQRALVAATERAVKLLDQGQVETVWNESSKAMQSKTGRSTFTTGVKAMRGAAGDLRSRRLAGIGFLDDLEGAPKGHYAAALFQTEFARVTAEERFIFLQEGKDWRLAGYFLRKWVAPAAKP